MNKAYYIKPAIEITEMSIEHAILAASGEGENNLPINGGQGTTTVGTKDHAFSVNVWGDDEE